MAEQTDPITIILTREEVERLIQILDFHVPMNIDVEHFLEILDKALHKPRPLKPV